MRACAISVAKIKALISSEVTASDLQLCFPICNIPFSHDADQLRQDHTLGSNLGLSRHQTSDLINSLQSLSPACPGCFNAVCSCSTAQVMSRWSVILAKLFMSMPLQYQYLVEEDEWS